MIVAGDFLPLSNIGKRIAFIPEAEVGVRRKRVVHELAVVAFQAHDSRYFGIRPSVATDELLHMLWQSFNLAFSNKYVEQRIESPHEPPAFDEFASEHAEPVDCARRKMGPDHEHRRASQSIAGPKLGT